MAALRKQGDRLFAEYQRSETSLQAAHCLPGALFVVGTDQQDDPRVVGE